MNKFTDNIVDINTVGGYTLDEIFDNKNCSKDPEYWYCIAKTKDTEEPKYLFRSKVAESWEFFDHEIVNPIRNTNQIYIRFLDTSCFVQPSNYFRRFGFYGNDPDGIALAADTLVWNKYWDDLEDKLDNGFEVGGVRITGRHFFFINFGRFRAIPVDKEGKATSTRKIWTFLKFLDHQYYMMNELDECLLEGVYQDWDKYHTWFPNKTKDDFELQKLTSFALAKGRRKGWTAQIAIGVFNYNFTFRESSMNILAAYEKSHYGPMLSAIHTTKTFLDKNTPWKRRTDIKGTRDHIIAGIETTDIYGMRIKEGYLSEVKASSFKDNPFKGIGESADIINIEEAGKFDRLLETFPISIEPLIRDGETMIGIAIAGGTAGDMESGGSTGLAEIMNKPKEWGFKAYDNIYEPSHMEGQAGWFIDDMWYSPLRIKKKEIEELDNSERTMRLLEHWPVEYIETVDAAGNSYRYFSELILNDKRERRRKISSITYQKFITQQPKYLSEAFLLNEASPFDTAIAKDVQAHLSVEKISTRNGLFSIRADGKTSFRQSQNLLPVDEFPFRGEDTTGCWVLYEDPIFINGEIPSWRYIAGCDPIDWGSDEVAENGQHSFAATYIIDSTTRNIVAEYISRPRKAEDYFEQLWRGLEYFNAYLLYENNLKSLFSYFKLKNKLYLLANEPESLKSRWGYKASNRTKGFHATAAANSYARELINTWSLEEVLMDQNQETGEPIFVPRMYFVKSKGLLEEIIRWNSKGNFDRVSSLGAAMILLFDRTWDSDDGEEAREEMFDTGIFEKMRNITTRKNKFNIR